MSCSERRLISGYLDDALSPRQKANLLLHLQECPDCAQLLARYRQMDILLRRLPPREPTADSRQRLLDRLSMQTRWRSWGWTRGAAAMFLIVGSALGFFAFHQVLPDRPDAGNAVVLSASPQEASTREVAQPISNRLENGGEDAAILQQVRRTVRRPGFRPLLPGYLPKGAWLDNVNLSPNRPGGPIDRLEMAFVATGSRVQLRQESADASSQEQQRLLRGDHPRLLTVGGHEWLYIRRDHEDRDAPALLIGSRDGIVIWLESSLPLEELEKIAASLQE